MPRIYKPVGPSANKALIPAKEIKTSENKSEPPKAENKKNNEQ